jgi:hypothetical protein
LPSQAGTKLTNFVLTGGPTSDLLEPVRSAIGMSLVSSLVLNEWNVLVEGAADKPIVEGIFFSHYNDFQKKILVNGSLSETKDAFLVQFYHRTGLPYVVLLDADSGGRDLFNELIKLRIPEERIVQLQKIFTQKKNDFAIEDILSADFYHKAVAKAYPANPVDAPNAPEGKRAKQYEEIFKKKYQIGFNKRRVAEMVKNMLAESLDDDETKKNLGTVSTELINRLNAQVSE